MGKLQEVNGRYLLYVPKDIVKRKKWFKGQEIFWFVNMSDESVRLAGDTEE